MLSPSMAELTYCLRKVIPNLPSDENLNLFTSMVIDSFSLLEVIATLEDTYHFSLHEDEMKQANFETLHQIHKTVTSLKGRDPK